MKTFTLIIVHYCANIDSFLLIMTTLMDISELTGDVSLFGKTVNPHREKYRLY
jgi:hypothetical protein